MSGASRSEAAEQRAIGFDARTGGGTASLRRVQEPVESPLKPGDVVYICGKKMIVSESGGGARVVRNRNGGLESIVVPENGSVTLSARSGTTFRLSPGVHTNAAICKSMEPKPPPIPLNQPKPAPTQPTSSTGSRE